MKLAHTIIDASKDTRNDELAVEIAEYEEEMFRRAKKAQQLTNGAMQCMMFTKDTPRLSIESWCIGMVSERMPPFLYPLIFSGICVFYFFYKNFI